MKQYVGFSLLVQSKEGVENSVKHNKMLVNILNSYKFIYIINK